MSDPVRIGLLGHGTVGAAFAGLLAERADAVEAATGRRPELAGTLTRSEGDFGEILERSDLIVELIGGTDPARDLRARRAAGRPAGRHRQQAAARPARRGALRRRPRGGGAAALRGRGGRGDPDRAHDPGELRRHRDRQGVRDRQRHHQLHPQRDGRQRRRLRAGAGAGAGAGLRRGRPERRRQRRRRRGEDGDPRPPRLPHRGHPRPGRLRGDRGDPARRPRLRQGARPLAEAARRRRAPRRRDQRPRLPLLPLQRPPAGPGRRPLQRGDGRGAGDHRGDDVGARRRRRRDRLGRARRRRLDPLRRRPGARGARASCRWSPTSPPPSTCTSRSPTSPACSPGSPRCWARTRSR